MGNSSRIFVRISVVLLSLTLLSVPSLMGNGVAFAAIQETGTLLPTETPTVTPTPTPTLVAKAQLSILGVEESLESDLNGNALFDPGDTLSVTVGFENFAQTTLNNIVLIYDYDQLYFDQIREVSANGIVNEGLITWELASLEPDMPSEVTFEVVLSTAFPAIGPTDVTSRVQISSDQLSGVNEIRDSFRVRVPQLTASKARTLQNDVNNDGIAGPGDTVLYTLTLANESDVVATSVLLADDYIEDLFESPQEITQSGEDNGDVLSWSLDTLDAGETFSASYELVVRSDVAPGSNNEETLLSVSSAGTAVDQNMFSYKVEGSASTSASDGEGGGAGTSSRVTDITGNNLAAMIGLLITGGLVVSALVIFNAGTLGVKHPEKVVRETIIITLVIGGVSVLALGGAIERSAAAGILGTVAGYLLRSVNDE